MQDFFEIISTLLVAAVAWAWVISWKSLCSRHFLLRHIAGFAASFIAWLVSVVFFANQAGWPVYLLIAGVVFVNIRRATLIHLGGEPAPQVTSVVENPTTKNFSVFRHAMPIPHDETSNHRLREWKSETNNIWSGDPRLITFRYENSAGDVSLRDVNVDEISEGLHGDIYISGFCNKRLERRTFLVDRITSKIAENGQRYEPLEWASNIVGHNL